MNNQKKFTMCAQCGKRFYYDDDTYVIFDGLRFCSIEHWNLWCEQNDVDM